MFLAGTLDAILELAPIVRELFGHFVGSARHVAAGSRYAIVDGMNACDGRVHD
jgi:hypothetical protein